MACILLWNSAVRVHDPHAYRKLNVTRERISRILKLREMHLSIQTGFNLVNAAVVCAILESISGLEPSSVIIEPRYLKLVTVSSFCPFTVFSVLMPLVLFVISLVFLALISMPWAAEALTRRSCLAGMFRRGIDLPLSLFKVGFTFRQISCLHWGWGRVRGLGAVNKTQPFSTRILGVFAVKK